MPLRGEQRLRDRNLRPDLIPVYNGIFAGLSSLEGGYAVMFRGYSAAVHPTSRTIGHFLSGRSGEVAVGRPVTTGTPIAASASTFTAMLFVCGQLFDWCDANRIAKLWRQSGRRSAEGRRRLAVQGCGRCRPRPASVDQSEI